MSDVMHPLETVFRRGVLGVRPLDLAVGRRPAGSLLRSWAQVLDSDSARVPGHLTASGVHSFTGLPGLGDWESPQVATGAPPDIPSPPSPPDPVDVGVVLEPTGPEAMATAMIVQAPSSTAIETLALSAPTRSAPAGFTALRGDLRLGGVDGPPARFALVILIPLTPSSPGESYATVANGSGSFCILLPTPSPLSDGNGGASQPLHERTVDFELMIGHDPAAQRFIVQSESGQLTVVDGSIEGSTVGALPAGRRAIPEIESLLNQSDVELIDPLGGAPIATLPLSIPFKSEAVARTRDDLPFVLIHA